MSIQNLPFDVSFLKEYYSEPHRVYHDLRHINDLLTLIDEHVENEEQALLLKAVAWFHDAFYDPKLGSPQNEQKSIEIFESVSHLFEPSQAQEIKDIILATSLHMTDQSNASALTQIFLDMDMGNFRLPFERYMEYTKRVFDEYVLSGYSENEVLRGQKDFAKKLLQKTNLYYTPLFKPQEDRARANLKRFVEEGFAPPRKVPFANKN